MHPIIALWSHPRSMSTATERIMRERGDLDCAHEPFMYDYYVHRNASQFPHFDEQSDHPQKYEDIRDMLIARAREKPVFFKDMSYYVMPHILTDVAFRDRVTHTFLIRNPEAAIASYYKLDPDVTSDEIGLAAQWNHYQGLCAKGHNPVILRSEDIQNDPEGMMAAFWASIGLEFRKNAFSWGDDTPKDWEQVEGWHGSVGASQSIRPMPDGYYEKARAKFQSMAQAAPRLNELLAQHAPAYEQLSARAMTQI